MYSIHDTYMAGMQRLLGTSEKYVNPNYGSAFVFELRKDSRQKYFVRVLNKNTVYPGVIRLNEVKINGKICKMCKRNSFDWFYLIFNF